MKKLSKWIPSGLATLLITYPLFLTTVCHGQALINTFAGNGTAGHSGDGGPATSAEITSPGGVTLDSYGNIYVCDGAKVRKISTSGTISTFAGTGTSGFSGDGGQATSAKISSAIDICTDASNNLYIVDGMSRIRKVSTSGIINTVAGNGIQAFTGDGGPATSAELYEAYGVVVDASGKIYINEAQGARVRIVNTSGTISTFAGNGVAGYSGDGGAATSAELHQALRVSVDPSGNVYISDRDELRVRMVNTSGVISTFAGNGGSGSSGDGGAATSAHVDPYGTCMDAGGVTYITDEANNRVRLVNTSGIIYTIGGNGTAGFSGDGGAATSAEFDEPEKPAIDNNGNLYIADALNNRIRIITLLTLSTSITNVLCNGGTGSASVTASNGKTPYTYSWAPSGGTNSSNTALSAATYTVYVSDNFGIKRTTSFAITQPSALSVSASTISNVSCNGGSNGSVSASVSGGTTPYTYAWVGGGTSSSKSGLSAGTYIIQVTDINGCASTASTSVTQPTQLNVSTSATYTIICPGNFDSLKAIPSGGTSPYTYAWSPSTALSCTTCQKPDASPTTSITYSVTVTDHNGCSATNALTITVDTIGNNSCATAIALPGGNSTTDHEFLGCQNTLMFSFVPDSANVFIRIAHTTSVADTPLSYIHIFQLYSGTCGSLTLLRTDTVPYVTGLLPSFLDTGLTPGTTYYLGVSRYTPVLRNDYVAISINNIGNTHPLLMFGNPPIIQWQYTSTPLFPPTDITSPGLKINPATYGENWFYDVAHTTDHGYICAGYAEITDPSNDYIWQPIMVKLDQYGNKIWEHLYDGGISTDPAYFWKVLETVDTIGQTVYLAMGVKSDAGGGGRCTMVVEVRPSDGTPTVGPYFYTTSGGSLYGASSGPLYVPYNFLKTGEYSTMKAVSDNVGLNGYIIGGKAYTTGNEYACLIKLKVNLKPDNSFGLGGFELYPYLKRSGMGYISEPSEGYGVEVINNGTSNVEYALTGYVLSAYTGSGNNDIFLEITDNTGFTLVNRIFDYTNDLTYNGYQFKDRVMSNNVFTLPANHDDRGISLLWVPSTQTLLLNAACDWNQPYTLDGGTYYSQVNPTYDHGDSYQTFTDAILPLDISGNFKTYIKNSIPFDGIDFQPCLITTPWDGGFALSGNLSYTSPDFPSPQASMASAVSDGIDAATGNPYYTEYNRLSNTLLGVNFDIVKFDGALGKQWEQQYRQWQGTPNNVAVTCNWGFAATQEDDGFMLVGNNEVNDEDYSALKIVPPSCTSAISEINPNTDPIDALLDTKITSNTHWGTGTVKYIEGVIDVEPGVTLTIDNGAHIYFADKLETGLDSKIVVEPGGNSINPTSTVGGKLIIGTSTTLVSGIPGTCNGGAMWQGIEVGGNPNYAPTSVLQGHVSITDATLSNAINGITDANYDAEDGLNQYNTSWTPHNSTSGSANIIATNANFYNNWRAIQLLQYDNIYAGKNSFTNCHFESNQALGHSLLPLDFVSVSQNYATFTGNTFDDVYESTTGTNQGNGIYSIDGKLDIYGSNNFNNLVFGVNEQAINPANYASITGSNNFNYDAYGVYISGSHYSTVNSNTFYNNRAISVPPPVAFPFITYGLYLNNCTGYSVQDNTFTGTTSQAGFGTIVNNSGALGNEINNNNYSTYSAYVSFMIGHNYVHLGGNAIQAQDLNSNLQIHCNQNTLNYYDIAAITNSVTTPPVANQQGQCAFDPTKTAGNTFSTCGSPALFNIYSNVYSFGYNYNVNAIFKPNCYSSVLPTPTACILFPSETYSNVCPDMLVTCPHCVCCMADKANFHHAHDSLQAILDYGDASELFTILGSGTPAQIQDTLLAHGPYLSDSVLFAAIAHSMPEDTLRNILIPNSPLDSLVLNAVDSLHLSSGIMAQIDSAQSGTSPRQELIGGINYFGSQETVMINAMIQTFLTDTTINGVDSALALLRTVGGTESEKEEVNFYILQGNYDSASAVRSRICTGTPSDFCTLSNVLIQLGDSNKTIYQMDSTQLANITIIANRSNQTEATLNAQAILTQVYGNQYPILILPIIDSTDGHKPIKNLKNGSDNPQPTILAGASQFKLYPNPANNQVTIEYNLDKTAQQANIIIYNIFGSKVADWLLPSGAFGANSIVENIASLAPGIYFYAIFVDNKLVQRSKLVITR